MSLFKKKELLVVKKELPPVTEQTVIDYMKAFGLAGNLEDHEVEAFKQMAVMHNLNPFNREIYCSAYGSGQYRTFSLVTGYEVYIRKAEQSGLLEYWTVEEAPPETPIERYWTKFIVKRHDKTREQSWTTHYSEAVQKKKDGSVNAFWKKQPRMMTKKVVMSQGFRIFFEDVLQGIPYTREEMPESKGGMIDVTLQPKTFEKPKPIEKASQELLEAEKELDAALDDKKSKDSQGNFSKIITLVNGQGIPNEDKIKILSAARACNKNEEELAIVLKNTKQEYSL